MQFDAAFVRTSSPTGLASVGNDAAKYATHSASLGTRLPFDIASLLFFSMMVYELDDFVRSGRTSPPARRGGSYYVVLRW